MGWLRKSFKKIGKGIKSAFMKFGKFMGKIGVVGQIAMMFILPGIGAALLKGVTGAFGAIVGQTAAQAGAAAAGTAAAGTAATTAAVTTATTQALTNGATQAAATAAGELVKQSAMKTATNLAIKQGVQGTATGLFAKGAAGEIAGHALQFAAKAVSLPGKVFTSVTKGITSTLTEFTKTAASKMGVNVSTASNSFFGVDSALSRSTDAFASPFSSAARARIATSKAQQALLKEGVSETISEDILSKAAEGANNSLPNPANLDVSTIRFDPKNANFVSSEGVVSEATASVAPETNLEFPTDSIEINDSLLSSKPPSTDISLDIADSSKALKVSEAQMAARNKALNKALELGKDTYTIDNNVYNVGVGEQFKYDISQVGVKSTDALKTKVSKLASPEAVLVAGAKTAVKTYGDAQYAAAANAREPEVIDLGISEDPRQFLSQDQSFFQNSSIGAFQVQNADTYKPQSSWAQQQLLMLQQQQQQGVYS